MQAVSELELQDYDLATEQGHAAKLMFESYNQIGTKTKVVQLSLFFVHHKVTANVIKPAVFV